MAVFASELFDFVKNDRISFDPDGFMTFFARNFLMPALQFEQGPVVVEPGGRLECPAVVASAAVSDTDSIKLTRMMVGVTE